MLKGFGVKNKIINSKVKDLPDQNRIFFVLAW
jgi:hypothetical protein